MTNLPKKITFAYDYIIKKTTTKPNAPKRKRDDFRQKSAVWSCRDTGCLAPPVRGCRPRRAVGSTPGTRGSSGRQLQPCGLSPYARCRGHSPNAALWGFAMGLQRISGTFLEPQGQLRSEPLPPGCEQRVDLIDAARPMDPTAHITRCCTLTSLMRAGVPDHPSEDNLHSLGTRGDGQLCRCILVDVWRMLRIHWDVSREGTRAPVAACRSPCRAVSPG